jgi:trehalose 6-phosphate phosphatase
VWVEDKGLSLTLHYRQSPQKAEARRRILAATRDLKQVRVFGGKQVVNVVPDKAPNKGVALAAERDRLRCDWVLYVGDDENDEDAFALEGNIVPVRIGRKQRSCARYYLRTQAEIDKLLELLVLLGEPVKPSCGR